MLYMLSKVIGTLLLPSNFLISIGALGMLISYTRYWAVGRKLLLICVAGLLLCGFLPVGNLLLIPIEARFPPRQVQSAYIDGIVVLGGGVERIIEAVALARDFPSARVVYTGGNVNSAWDTREADIAARLFDRLGVARDRLLLEEHARNTLENAEFAKAIAAPKPGEHWLLVTSASHMPRAIGVFRNVAFPVEAYPVDWKANGWSDLFKFQHTFSDGIVLVDVGAREWMGLLAYRLMGRTSELLPSLQ
jgi:uncharacterized SAM-binding protein YcdF (DUF218 family)